MYPKTVVYDYAMSFIGEPYRWGGDDSIDGFDCSGLCIEILCAAGVLPPHQDYTAAGLAEYFGADGVEKPSFGCLVFFGKDRPTHVAFCLNDTLMLEAGGGGSATLTREDAAAQNAFVRIRPIANRKDILCYKLPLYAWEP